MIPQIFFFMSQKSVFHHPRIQCWVLQFKTKQTSISGCVFLTIWWYFTRLSTELSKNCKISKFVLTWTSKCKQSCAIASFQHEFDMLYHQSLNSLCRNCYATLPWTFCHLSQSQHRILRLHWDLLKVSSCKWVLGFLY